MKRLLSIILALTMILGVIALPASAMTQQEMLERVRQMVASPTPAPTATPAPTQEPAAEEPAEPAEGPAEGEATEEAADESPAAPADPSFRQGYIEVKAGLRAYRSASSKAQPAGVFQEKGYAFALRVNDTWLETAFVNAANRAMTVVYVKAAEVKTVDDKAATAMLTTLRKAPKYEGFPLPTVKFGAEEAPQPTEEPAPAEEPAAEETGEEEPAAEETPAAEEPAEDETAGEPGEDGEGEEALQPAGTVDSETVPGETVSEQNNVPGVTVTLAPNMTTVLDGFTVIITSSVSGTTGTLVYQWQFTTNNGKTWSSTTLSGNKTGTLTFQATKGRIEGKMYRVSVKDDNGTSYSDPVSFTWAENPVITAAADSEFAVSGSTVTIRATVSGAAGTPAFQWQYTSNGGNTWNNTILSGNKTDTLTFPATESRLTGKQYRVQVKDDNGTWYSNSVSIAWGERAAEITAKADKDAVVLGAQVVIRATAHYTTGAISYQWQYSTTGKTWSNTVLSGNKTATLSFPATESRLVGKQYRCAVTDEKGTWYSNAVTVSLAEINVTATPNSEFAGEGDTVIITAQVEGGISDLTYQWQFTTNGTTWSNTVLSGNKTATLSFPATKARLNGKQYRCAVTDGSFTRYSNAVSVAWLNVTVTATADKARACAGETVTITASAQGTTGELSYVWQTSADGTSWTNVEGGQADTLTFTATQDLIDGKLFRCAVTDQNATWYSDPVSIAWYVDLIINAEASAEYAMEKDEVTLTATVETEGEYTYQWQYTTNGTSWNNTVLPGYNTAALTFEANKSRLVGKEYRCKVSDGTDTWYSNSVSVNWAPGGFIFGKDSEDRAAVVGYIGPGGDIVIPDQDNAGSAILAIAKDAFKGNTDITSVTMCNTIVIVGVSAFENCTNLTTVTFSSDLEVIDVAAFKNCTSLSSGR